MANEKPASFFGMPTLGGKLTLINANSWIVLYFLMRGGAIPEWLFEYLAIPLTILFIFLALPIGIFGLVPSLGGPSVSDIVWSAVLLGLNSFVWGYGLAWCYEKGKRWFGKRPKSP